MCTFGWKSSRRTEEEQRLRTRRGRVRWRQRAVEQRCHSRVREPISPSERVDGGWNELRIRLICVAVSTLWGYTLLLTECLSAAQVTNTNRNTRRDNNIKIAVRCLMDVWRCEGRLYLLFHFVNIKNKLLKYSSIQI